MKEFSYFLVKNEVKKQSPDLNQAKATAKDGLDRLEMAKAILASQKPKYVLENAYEAIREVIDAVLFLEGYKSYSHEASVAYLLLLGFSISEAEKVDWLRRIRNGTKYYGKDAEKEEALEAIKVAESIFPKILDQKPNLKKEIK
ncbi:MAG: HEPN domain-containing protein [Nanoarchaeota archaeon]